MHSYFSVIGSEKYGLRICLFLPGQTRLWFSGRNGKRSLLLKANMRLVLLILLLGIILHGPIKIVVIDDLRMDGWDMWLYVF